jgi:putative oxidoreductase
MLVAIIELCICFLSYRRSMDFHPVATLGATLAMIGPGAWSIDAQLFGRKHFED